MSTLFPQPDDLTFGVATRPLTIQGRGDQAFMIDSHKAIVRMDPNDPEQPLELGVVGKDYTLLRHSEYFDRIDKAIVGAFRDEDLEGAYVDTSMGYSGAYARRQYVLPALQGTIETTGVDSQIGFRVIAWNSYDGTTSAGLLCGLIDFYCSNGMLLGSFIGKKLRRHTSGMDLDVFAPTLKESAGEVHANIDAFRQMAGLKIDYSNVKRFFEKSCGFSPRLAEKMYDQFREESKLRGQTAWAVYSTLTNYSSHGEADSRFMVRQTGNDNAVKTLHMREMQVQRIVSGMDWNRLAA